jgi:hypothetical protein
MSPAIGATTLSGPGTFSQVISPALNVPLTIQATVTVQFNPGQIGYVTITIVDQLATQLIFAYSVTLPIEAGESADGSKMISVSIPNVRFANAASLAVSVSTTKDPAAVVAPVITSASLGTFTAS